MNQSNQAQIVALNKLNQPRQFVLRIFSIWERGIYWRENALPIGNVTVKQSRDWVSHVPQKIRPNPNLAEISVYFILQWFKTGFHCLFKRNDVHNCLLLLFLLEADSNKLSSTILYGMLRHMLREVLEPVFFWR